MFFYATILNDETKECSVGIGTNEQFYESIGMTKMDVEQAYNGTWYIVGYAPEKPRADIIKQEIQMLKKSLADSDYKVVKCTEYQLSGIELPYDIVELQKTRQSLRDKINELEQELNEIS